MQMYQLLKKVSIQLKLTDLMFTNNVGVSQESVYIIKRIDQDYFEE